MMLPTIILSLFVAFCTRLASSTPYDQYILTPTSRTLIPVSVYNVNGSVENAEAITPNASGVATFRGPSAVTYDFGRNIAGIVSFNVSSVQGDSEFIGISFTESSLWINSNGCDGTNDTGIDEALWYPVSSGGSYAAEKRHQRGGFKYLNVYHNTSGSVELDTLSIHYTAIPHKSESELGVYTGYFHTDDEQLNRIWYAGAYTNEMCTIDPTAGDSLIGLEYNISVAPGTPGPWWNNNTIANGTSVLVDGGKRDRLVWPGDIAISGPSVFVSTNDMISIKNSLDSLLVLQNSSGALPYAGVPFILEQPSWSFTYHLYSLIDIYDFYLFTGNTTYLTSNWDKFKLGLNFSLQFIDSTGLAYVTTSADWLRFGMGGHNIEANSILYYTLNLGMTLANVLNDTSNATSSWSRYADNIEAATNERLWDSSVNLFRDNDTVPLTDLHPQDGNAWAVVSGLVSTERAANISSALASRWGPYGAPAPEADATVSPFVSGFEIQAHYIANHPDLAIQLMKLQWGDFMLDDPRMTNSSFIEGYSTDGSLHYAPYTNDPRVSHAHGWSTGPTSTLTFYAAGLRVTSAAGKTWSISPNLGSNLTTISAGFGTHLGKFSVSVSSPRNATGELDLRIMTPPLTTGSISLPAPPPGGSASVLTLTPSTNQTSETPMTVHVPAATTSRIEVANITGGEWFVTLRRQAS